MQYLKLLTILIFLPACRLESDVDQQTAVVEPDQPLQMVCGTTLPNDIFPVQLRTLTELDTKLNVYTNSQSLSEQFVSQSFLGGRNVMQSFFVTGFADDCYLQAEAMHLGLMPFQQRTMIRDGGPLFAKDSNLGKAFDPLINSEFQRTLIERGIFVETWWGVVGERSRSAKAIVLDGKIVALDVALDVKFFDFNEDFFEDFQ